MEKIKGFLVREIEAIGKKSPSLVFEMQKEKKYYKANVAHQVDQSNNLFSMWQRGSS